MNGFQIHAHLPMNRPDRLFAILLELQVFPEGGVHLSLETKIR